MYSHTRGNILFCEDDLGMREFWTLYFKNEGWQVVPCIHPDQALDILSQGNKKFDFGYFDVHYRDSIHTGFDLAEFVNSLPKPFPFYIMSISQTDTKIRESKRVGAKAFVLKDFDHMVSSFEKISLNNLQ